MIDAITSRVAATVSLLPLLSLVSFSFAAAAVDARDARPYQVRRDGGIAPYQMVQSVGNVRPSYIFPANLCNATTLNYVRYCNRNALFDMASGGNGYSLLSITVNMNVSNEQNSAKYYLIEYKYANCIDLYDIIWYDYARKPPMEVIDYA